MYENAKQWTTGHLSPDEVRKIQQFLKYTMNDGARYRNAKEYYAGEIDGVFGPQTYQAILDYQRDHGLKEDGMWGIRTNGRHKVLTRTWGAREDSNGDQLSHYTVNHTKPSDYQKIINWALSNDDNLRSFWGNNQKNTYLRERLQELAPGILETIYDNTPDYIQNTISPKKYTRAQSQTVHNNDIRQATENAAPIVLGMTAAPALATSLVAAPVATGVGLLGTYLGGKALGTYGESLGTDIGRNNQNYGFTTYSLTGTPQSNITPDASQQYGQYGKAIGTGVGSVLGGAAGAYTVKNVRFDPSYNPTDIQMRAPKAKYREINPDTGKFVRKTPTIKTTSTPTPRRQQTNLFPRTSSQLYSISTGQPIKPWETEPHMLNYSFGFKQGGVLKAQNGTFEDFWKTLPHNQQDSTNFNVRRYWELFGKPKNFVDAVERGAYKMEKDDKYHAYSVAENENGDYEFMKNPNHPTLKYELDWYNSDTPDAVEFRKQYQLDTTSTPWRYKIKLKPAIKAE